MPTIPTPQSSNPGGRDPSLPGQEDSASGQTGDRNQDGAIPKPGQPGQPGRQGSPGDPVGGRPGEPSGTQPGEPAGGLPSGGDPSDPHSAGLPGLPGENDGWESSNEDPGDGRPSGGTRRPGADGEETRQARGRPGAQGEFDEAIGVLDGQILAERADVYARRNETAGQSGRAAPPSGGEPETPSEQAPGVPGPPSPGVMPEGGGRQPGRPAPRAIPAPAAPVPPDVADAQDDDVVCRQLREAAMAETDDTLREALWDEYRRCREG